METIKTGDQMAKGQSDNIPVKRLLSLDFFRGGTVAAMILVNNPGDWSNKYSFLEHSQWNGCTPADLIFPFFLFIIGVSIVYAMETKKTDRNLHPILIRSILRRSGMIILLGLGLSLLSDFQFSHMRIPGVLPRIALVFGISAILYIKTTAKTQIYIIAGLLIGYYLVMILIPVPGIGPANLEPSRNLGAWLDRAVFSEDHLWSGSKTWDPEGLLATLPAVSTTMLGILTGTWLKKGKLRIFSDLRNSLAVALLFGIIGLTWNTFFPINKSLWSSSFVLYTASLAIVILVFCYWIIDIKRYNIFISPFVAFGRNPITAYVIAGILPLLFSKITLIDKGHKTNIWAYIHSNFFAPNLTPNNASLASAVLIVLLIFFPIWWMHKKNMIIKI